MNAPGRTFTAWLVAMVMAAPEVSADPTRDPLGRLFMSAKQREMLEHQRQIDALPARSGSADTRPLNGIVTRSSGATTLWINPHALTADQRRLAAHGTSPRTATSKILN